MVHRALISLHLHRHRVVPDGRHRYHRTPTGVLLVLEVPHHEGLEQRGSTVFVRFPGFCAPTPDLRGIVSCSGPRGQLGLPVRSCAVHEAQKSPQVCVEFLGEGGPCQCPHSRSVLCQIIGHLRSDEIERCIEGV